MITVAAAFGGGVTLGFLLGCVWCALVDIIRGRVPDPGKNS